MNKINKYVEWFENENDQVFRNKVDENIIKDGYKFFVYDTEYKLDYKYIIFGGELFEDNGKDLIKYSGMIESEKIMGIEDNENNSIYSNEKIIEKYTKHRNLKKLKEMFPLVKKIFPKDIIYIDISKISLNIKRLDDDVNVEEIISFNDNKTTINNKFDYIWEDKNTLTVKKHNPMPQLEVGMSINKVENVLVCMNGSGVMATCYNYWTRKTTELENIIWTTGIEKLFDNKGKIIWEQ